MTVVYYILLFGSVILAGLSFFIFKKNNPRILKLSLAFSGAFLFAITVLHLIPDAYKAGGNIGIFILAGFLFQLLLELFSEGIEHGHIHVHHEKKNLFPSSVMIGLCIHSFFEGMPLVGRSGEVFHPALLYGIILHHLPVAFALMFLLISSGVSAGRSIFFLTIFALMAPSGSYCSVWISGFMNENSGWSDKIMGIVIGIFLHISTTILFETGEEHRFNFYKMAAILTGVGLAMISF